MNPAFYISCLAFMWVNQPEPFQPVRATVAYVHDGDTLNADLHLPFGVTLPSRSIRAHGYDAWEVTKNRRTVKVTDAEIKKGLKARGDLMELLKTGTLYVEDMSAIYKQPDPYGRTLARLWVQVMSYPDQKPTVTWVLVEQWMDERGHLRTPRGER